MAHYVSHSSSQCFVQTFHKAKKIKSKMDVVFPCFSYWIQSDSGPLKHGARLFTGVQIVGVGQGGAQLTSHLGWGMDPSDPKGPKVGCLFSNHWTMGSTPIAGWFIMEHPNLKWMITRGTPMTKRKPPSFVLGGSSHGSWLATGVIIY